MCGGARVCGCWGLISRVCGLGYLVWGSGVGSGVKGSGLKGKADNAAKITGSR